MTEKRMSSSSDDGFGKGEWTWENNSRWLGVRTGRDMNARSERKISRIVKQLTEEDERGNEKVME